MYFESFLFSDPENSFFSKKEFSLEEKSKKESFEEVSSLPSQIIELGEGGVGGTLPTDPSIHNAEGLGFATAKRKAQTPEKQILGRGLFPAAAKQDFEEKISLKKEESLSFSTNFQNSLQKRLQTKIVELAKHYNEESIEAVTNFFADILSFATLWFLLVRLEIQINITKSFLLEVFFGLDDSKKSLLILFLTDLLVGYHSPNIWELFFQTFFDHYGLPESQTTIFLLVATLPVLLDVLFKYLIFRHLNRASPATVATYHAMIE
jgi:hypothetical protein